MSLIKQKESSEMKKLLDDKQYFNLPKIGDLVKGAVINAGKDGVYIDLNGIATGIVRGREVYSEAEQYKNLKPGDEVEATVLDLENENGEIELSFRFAGRQRAWQNLKELESGSSIIQATITDANKGGLMIKVEGAVGFLPVSQLSPENYPRVPGGDKNRILEILKSYIGKKFDVKIIDAIETEDKLIVSEKAAWEETQKEVMEKYKIGKMVEGEVTAVTDFGVFIRFDDKMEGLVHISEIAWQRIDNPSDFVKVGQRVKAEIIGIEGSKIFLSMKKLLDDPWTGVEKKYGVGQKVKGKILKVNPFGLFVELDQDIHGLAHISALSDKPMADINEFAKIGEEKDFYVLSLDPKNHRLGLSLVKPKEKPAEKPEEKKDEETKAEAKAEKKAEKAEKKAEAKIETEAEVKAEKEEAKIEEAREAVETETAE